MKKILAIILLFPFTLLLPQKDSTKNINEILNSILEESIMDEEDSQLFDLIEDLLNNPININSASESDLLRVPVIDLQTVKLIIGYRNKNGSYHSLQQLYSIKGFH